MNGFAFAPIFGDGMVLQRDRTLTVWGTSDCRSAVHVSLGAFRGDCAVENGTWKCVLPPMKAGRGLTLCASQDGQTICVQNVMVGDVWLAGGQSNMEFFLRYEKHWMEAQALPVNDGIRMYTCPRIAYAGQESTKPGCGYWFGEGDDGWETFASAAYWFARELQPELDVPVGIVSCNWGGTSASAWVPKDSLTGSPLDVYLKDYDAAVAGADPEELRRASMRGWEFQSDPDHLREWAGVMYGIDREAQLERIVRCANNPLVPMGPYNKNRPGCLFEQMVLPIRDYAIKGVLWYQGENDVHHAPLYQTLFTTLIREWRKLWGPDLPFLFAQLAPFERWLALDGDKFPEIRRQQDLVSRTVDNCWMISTADAGMRYDIHPKEKKVLGHRFFLQAMDKVYGRACPADGPEAAAAELRGDGIHIRFRNAGESLCVQGDLLPLFSVVQDQEALTPEDIRVEADMLILAVRLKGESPVALSFGEVPYADAALYNGAMIPAKPFSITIRKS